MSACVHDLLFRHRGVLAMLLPLLMLPRTVSSPLIISITLTPSQNTRTPKHLHPHTHAHAHTYTHASLTKHSPTRSWVFSTRTAPLSLDGPWQQWQSLLSC